MDTLNIVDTTYRNLQTGGGGHTLGIPAEWVRRLGLTPRAPVALTLRADGVIELAKPTDATQAPAV